MRVTSTTLLLLFSFASAQSSSSAALGASQQRGSQPHNLVLSDLVLALGSSNNKSDINHHYWFQRLFHTSLSPAEEQCLRNGSVYYAPTRSCHFLYVQGPCRATEWLVMEGSADGRRLWARCARRPCAPGFDFLAEGDQRLCVREADACKKKMDAKYRSFKYSLKGEGQCGCKGFRLLGPDDRCHLLFEQGPCPQGQMLVPSYSASLDSMGSVCVPKHCRGDERTYRVVMENSTVYQNCPTPEELKCVPTFDPIFTSWVDLSVPLCVDLNRAAVSIATRPAGCVIVAGRCSASVVVRSAIPYDWDVEDDLFSERSAPVDDAATSTASASPRLRRHLTLSALYSALFT